MRRYHHSRQQDASTTINLTPLIDMVFILLIFFLVTASFSKESGIQVNRPTAQTSERQELSSMVISITGPGEIWMDGRRIERHAVRSQAERLQAQNPRGTVIIATDRKAHAGLLMEVMDQVRQAGMEDIAIAAIRPQG